MCCISWIQAPTLEPNNVRGQIHLASSAELHRTDLAELSLSTEALCCTALCALWWFQVNDHPYSILAVFLIISLASYVPIVR